MKFICKLTAASLAFGLAGCGSLSRTKAEGGGGSALAGDTDGTCYHGDAFACAAEQEIIRLNNQYRVQNGLPELTVSGRMGFVARSWSKVQGDRGDIGHDGFPDLRTTTYKGEFGSMDGVWIAGENVAMFGPAGSLDAVEVGRRLAVQWWNSSGHRANMLGQFAGLGVGVFRTASGDLYGTQDFYKLDH